MATFTPAAAQVVRAVFPESSEQGTIVTLRIGGSQTSWSNPGGAFVVVSGDGVRTGDTMVLGDNAVEVSLTIAGNATPGAREVSVVSSGRRLDDRTDFPLEIATGGVFTVVAAPEPAARPASAARIIGVFPNQIERGIAQLSQARDLLTLSSENGQLVVAGSNTNFELANTIVTFSGTGITYDFRTQTAAVTPTTIVINFVIEAGAPIGPRDVTVVTGRGDTAEVVTLSNAFTVVANDNFDLSRLSGLGLPPETFSISESLRTISLKSDPLTSSPTVRNGEEITVSALVVNTGPSTKADFYVAVQLPNGRVMFLASDGQAFVTTLTPLAQNVTVPEGFPPTTIPLYTSLVERAEPGIFTIFTAFTEPGTLEPLGDIGVKNFLVLGDLKLPGDE